MCGIVGLVFKQAGLGNQLGLLLFVMRDRAPDSNGFARYGAPSADHPVKLTTRAPLDTPVQAITAEIPNRLAQAVDCTVRESHAVLSAAGMEAMPVKARATLSTRRSSLSAAPLSRSAPIGIEQPMKDHHRAPLRTRLDADGQADDGDFRRYGSTRRLYHFHVDNAGDY